MWDRNRVGDRRFLSFDRGVHEDNVVLEVQINDVADKNITSYEADVGLHVVLPLSRS